MGNCWEHEIRIESRKAGEERGRYPVCIDGAGACPLEDCGGLTDTLSVTPSASTQWMI
ncbi:plasmid pRiA4b ORF-3 family protein [Mesorhizobium sp. CGMCC 1.15528]|jgi:hypothetical protein|uniref:Plasmid pRiA4b ORF-3 family protein n=1 Tax=Mesorhizobium zhangyense TaxID=1776730 RepID=A0A7C9RBU2_9HYPH|nr:plasmid pRiA4b ORF-3 family protein [Mesorhizobium zhangyense]NGN44757.1 plasmid pRiA4b ORF-3 family protein [Mesorhizobium zhangyense]